MSLKHVGEDIILSKTGGQVMMGWEQPYMEATIDMLQPIGNVLEIGFGLGYSATQIMKHKPKSYTIIECESMIIEKAKEWSKKYPSIPITIVEGTWQICLHNLGIFDQIYFDDYPLELTKKSTFQERVLSHKRLNLFVALCIQNHTHIGSKISWYMNGNPKKLLLGSDSEPFITLDLHQIEMIIPEICKYRNVKEQQCTIPLLTKVKEYNFQEAQRLALKQIETDRTKIKFLKNKIYN